MRLSINIDSLNALRELSTTLPKIINQIYTDTQNLLIVHKRLKGELGPHKEFYEELLNYVILAQQSANEALTILSYMITNVADQMEQYLQDYGTTGVMVRTKAHDIQKEHAIFVERRLNNQEGNIYAVQLFEKYKPEIKVLCYNYIETSHYDPFVKGIRFHALEDMHSVVGACSVYFHEVGHLIDDLGGKDHCSWLSSDHLYLNYLIEDFQNYVWKVQLEKNCCQEEAFDIICEDLWDFGKAEVSDIYGSLSECRCQGCWGHDPNYWYENKENDFVAKEAFANMFEASIGDERKIKMMKQYLPLSYQYFESMVKREVEK